MNLNNKYIFVGILVALFLIETSELLFNYYTGKMEIIIEESMKELHKAMGIEGHASDNQDTQLFNTETARSIFIFYFLQILIWYALAGVIFYLAINGKKLMKWLFGIIALISIYQIVMGFYSYRGLEGSLYWHDWVYVSVLVLGWLSVLMYAIKQRPGVD